MEINEKILNFLNSNNNLITTEQVIELGFTRSLISKYEKAGLLERVRQGIYTLPNSIHDEMYTMNLKSNKIIFSHESALFLNGLSERTPFIHSVTIPSTTKLSKTLSEECQCYYIKPEYHEIGITFVKTTLGNEVKCYDSERTICDLIRSRNRLDDDLVISAIKNYAASQDKDINKLKDYAYKFGIFEIISRYLEVLL